MKGNVSNFVIFSWIVNTVLGDGTIIKYITQDKETITIKCPRGFVIFDPSVKGVVTKDNASSWTPAKCTGLPASIMRQMAVCQWRRKCSVSFRRNDTIPCNQTEAVSEENLSFVEIQQPHCIPKDSIIDTHAKSCEIINQKRGVIRSHKKYPRLQRRAPRSYRIVINIRPSYTLYMALRRPKECNGKSDLTLRRLKNGKRYLVKDAFQTRLVFHSNITDGIELTVKKKEPHKTCRQGFILPFSSYPAETVSELMEWPESSFSVIKDLEWIFEVRAVIEQCMVDSTGKAFLTCKRNEVIYSPEFSVAAYTRYVPACISAKYPCGGHTPMTLVQQNSCFWKNSCQVTWNGQVPILMSKVTSCIGYAASVIGMYGHRCVPTDQIFDMCSNCSKTITSDWGIIRSHPSYPWFFNSDTKYSKRIIQIGPGKRLLLIIQDINLDPDGRDKFSLTHQSTETSSTVWPDMPVIKQVRRLVLRTKEATSGVMVEVSGGILEVNFRPHEKTKGGRGFVLVFKKYKTDLTKLSGDITQIPKDAVVVSDASKPIRLRLNRRNCSGGRRRRRKGLACRARVWTDYFTKIE